MDWTSHHMERIPASGTLKMFDLAQRIESQGKKVYHFEVGQPDFPTPEIIVEAGIKALKHGLTRYVSSRGIPQLLEAIEKHYQSHGISIDGKQNVIVTPGAKMALYMAILSSIDAGDDVLVLSPAWPTYRVLIRIVGGKPVDVHTGTGYNLDEEILKAAMAKTVSGLIINSPNNPTGGVLTKENLKLINDLATDHDFVVFSDEIYETLVYDGFKQPSMLEIDPSLERTLIVNGFSKAYAMTGWRLGFAVGNPQTIENMVRIQQNTTSCATSFVQYAGVEAINGGQNSIEIMRKDYENRRNQIVELLNEIEGIKCNKPKGAFYVFPDFSYFGLSSTTLAEILLKNVGVSTAPGAVFGNAYDNHLRFSYATALPVIKEGIGIMSQYLAKMRLAV